MELHFGDFRLDIDPAATAACAALYAPTDCAPFAAALDRMPEIRAFFAALGLAPTRPAEVYSLDSERMYAGFYHLCGRLLAGESAWQPAADGQGATWDDSRTYAVTEQFRVSFAQDCALLPADFPRPAIQLDFVAELVSSSEVLA